MTHLFPSIEVIGLVGYGPTSEGQREQPQCWAAMPQALASSPRASWWPVQLPWFEGVVAAAESCDQEPGEFGKAPSRNGFGGQAIARTTTSTVASEATRNYRGYRGNFWAWSCWPSIG